MRLFKKVAIFLLILPCTLVFFFVIYLGSNLLRSNFHTVVPGKIYRSAQLDRFQLAYYTKKYHIRTIINLRGYHPQHKWYQQETTYAGKHGLVYYNLQLSAHKLPSKKQLRKLVYILQNSQKPILVHCKYGADRSGLASAISIILSNNKSLDDMQDQISWQYGVVSPTTIGYQVMTNYLYWLQQGAIPYGKNTFINWVYNDKKLKPYAGIYFT